MQFSFWFLANLTFNLLAFPLHMHCRARINILKRRNLYRILMSDFLLCILSMHLPATPAIVREHRCT